jgi:hypothetical protein
VRGSLIAALALGAVSSVGSARAQYLVDPYQIFARARAYWLEQRYPPLIEYRVAVAVLEAGSLKTQRYWSAYDSGTGQVAVDPVSDYERAHPAYAAPGLNLHFQIPLIQKALGRSQPPVDYLGVPLLAPNYTFGMGEIRPTNSSATPDPDELVREVRAAYRDPAQAQTAPPQPSSGAPPIIEQETVYRRVYRVTLEGVGPIYGAPAYHLRLQALRDPGRYRLEQLWIDTRNFAPIALIEGLNFVEGPGTEVPWRVRFTKIDGALYIYDETALRPMRYDGLVYTQAVVAFENVHAVDQLSRYAPLFAPEAPLIMSEPTFP